MNAPIIVFCAWLLFAGTHLLLGMPPLRNHFANKFGEQRFVAMFSGIAGLCLGLMASAVALFGGDGPAGFALGRLPAMRAPLAALAFLGLALAMAGLLNYLRSPMALFRTKLHPPTGIERITRHAFFMGLMLFATAHALLASTMAIGLYFAGFAVLAAVGALLQDRKLLVKYGAAYARYLEATSLVPFVALIQRRQTITPEDRLLRQAALSAAIAALLLAAHPLWSLLHGAPLAGLMAVGGIFVSARCWRHSKATARALAKDVASSPA